MSKKPQEPPTVKRRRQIEAELQRLALPKNLKKRKDFKSEELFEAWKNRLEGKLSDLSSELLAIDDPEPFDELPLAVAAEELGVRLEDMIEIVREDLAETTAHDQPYPMRRVHRDELARLQAIGGPELVRLSGLSAEDIFREGLTHLHSGDVAAAEKVDERLGTFTDWRSPFPISYEIGLALVKGDLEALFPSMEFIGGEELDYIAVVLPVLREAVEGVTTTDVASAVLKERILAVASGAKKVPFRLTFSSYETSEYFSKMDETQRHAMFLANVVFAAVEKYKLRKELERFRAPRSEGKREELERVIRNALYTALEAEATYHDSPSSRLFVNKFVELFPKRWIPARATELLPATRGGADRE